jgi:hypothetical protein
MIKQSAKAVYVVVSLIECDHRFTFWLLTCSKSYDYSLQKVKLYTRVPLGDIVGISKGQLN